MCIRKHLDCRKPFLSILHLESGAVDVQDLSSFPVLPPSLTLVDPISNYEFVPSKKVQAVALAHPFFLVPWGPKNNNGRTGISPNKSRCRRMKKKCSRYVLSAELPKVVIISEAKNFRVLSFFCRFLRGKRKKNISFPVSSLNRETPACDYQIDQNLFFVVLSPSLSPSFSSFGCKPTNFHPSPTTKIIFFRH